MTVALEEVLVGPQENFAPDARTRSGERDEVASLESASAETYWMNDQCWEWRCNCRSDWSRERSPSQKPFLAPRTSLSLIAMIRTPPSATMFALIEHLTALVCVFTSRPFAFDGCHTFPPSPNCVLPTSARSGG